jgi:UDP-4-amino-4,6-dideoxy-N-acetyl-beta-L-altrosamine N-acetyltransferase
LTASSEAGQTNGVTWRSLLLGDLERILAWRNSQEIRQFMYTDHEISPAEHARWFGEAMSSDTRIYWIIELDGLPVGLANLYDISTRHERAYWAFYLADAAVRGRGVGSATERFVLNHAFSVLGLNKLCCEVLATNESVVRMHQRYGFAIDGTLRGHIRKDDSFVDVVALSILREEWEGGRWADG